jgi:hypothetical protein
MARFKHIVEGFFTQEECKGFITFSEKEGYSESLIRSKDGEVVNKSIRDNDRVIWDNPQCAGHLWDLVKDMVPSDIDGYEPIGLNDRFRFYRYKDGQQFKPHVDAPYKKSESELSKLTLLIYLNEDFEGGATTLVLEGEDIKPKEGMLFLFEQKIMHCGRPVTTGTKYVLRTDVMYRLKR